MSSVSLQQWLNERQSALDEIEQAHQSVGGVGPGRRVATVQLNHAYAVLLSSQFQGFCRDLHSEAANFLAGEVGVDLRSVLRNSLIFGRQLDKGNPNPESIRSDFGRFDMKFWDEVNNLDVRNQVRQNRLVELNRWRNAIAHQDFNPQVLGAATLRLDRVRRWRQACDQLAKAFDQVMARRLQLLTGKPPW